jgi:hypothetical protein
MISMGTMAWLMDVLIVVAVVWPRKSPAQIRNTEWS